MLRCTSSDEPFLINPPAQAELIDLIVRLSDAIGTKRASSGARTRIARNAYSDFVLVSTCAGRSAPADPDPFDVTRCAGGVCVLGSASSGMP
ncbi:hypothetical protein BH11MYX4_BH11MYX4_28660 [soil metagenome]